MHGMHHLTLFGCLFVSSHVYFLFKCWLIFHSFLWVQKKCSWSKLYQVFLWKALVDVIAEVHIKVWWDNLRDIAQQHCTAFYLGIPIDLKYMLWKVEYILVYWYKHLMCIADKDFRFWFKSYLSWGHAKSGFFIKLQSGLAWNVLFICTRRSGIQVSIHKTSLISLYKATVVTEVEHITISSLTEVLGFLVGAGWMKVLSENKSDWQNIEEFGERGAYFERA